MINITEQQILTEKPASVLTSSEDRAARLSTCQSCPEKKTVAGVDICNKCDCVLVLKTLIKLAPCPLNNWVIPVNELPKEK